MPSTTVPVSLRLCWNRYYHVYLCSFIGRNDFLVLFHLTFLWLLGSWTFSKCFLVILLWIASISILLYSYIWFPGAREKSPSFYKCINSGLNQRASVSIAEGAHRPLLILSDRWPQASGVLWPFHKLVAVRLHTSHRPALVRFPVSLWLPLWCTNALLLLLGTELCWKLRPLVILLLCYLLEPSSLSAHPLLPVPPTSIHRVLWKPQNLSELSPCHHFLSLQCLPVGIKYPP